MWSSFSCSNLPSGSSLVKCPSRSPAHFENWAAHFLLLRSESAPCTSDVAPFIRRDLQTCPPVYIWLFFSSFETGVFHFDEVWFINELFYGLCFGGHV